MKPENLIIVMAEDDLGHASLVQRTFKRAGLLNPIVHVLDGQEAIDYIFAEGAHSSRPSVEGASPAGRGSLLLLLDINMPRLDGVEVLRRLKNDPRGAQVPVIMLTTTDDPREIQHCYELGCSAYVTKPVAYDEFIEAVRRLGLFLSIVQVPSEDART